ncbi:TIGR00341 family protein [Halosolutus gelatinilyticus]|uniref:TIGR00341 family protein n=1 Tax=Halosolutus gelatinilyticus TaxID=2931975 RepID=UPI001FF40B51|nr:TIGR00341 family protein [Halosolutus gelatinilyticus]
MRRLELVIPAEYKNDVSRVLDEEEVGYTASGPLDGPDEAELVTISFPAPVNAVEPILDRLWDYGLEDDDASVVVLPAESIISNRADALRSRYSSSAESGTRIAREELLARAQNLVPGMVVYFVMLILSVVIAVAGLVANSVAVVVGSMVVAPLMGPALAASVGTVVGDRELFVRGISMQISGVVVSVIVAIGFASLVRYIHIFPVDQIMTIGEISSRTSPDFLALVVAIAAGAAGAYSLSTGSSTSLVGVAVAAALVPPLGVVGIGLAWGRPMVSIGALILVLVNLLAINLVAIAGFYYQGYRPRNWSEIGTVRIAARRRIAVLAVCLLVLSSFLGVVTIGELRAATIREDVRADVTEVIDNPAYADANLVEVQFISDNSLPTSQPERVVVTVGHPPGESFPGLLNDLRDAVDDSIVVDLNFEQEA